MSNFTERAGTFATSAAQVAKELASYAARKTRQVSRITKLNLDISAQKNTIKKAYTQIGKLYYEANREHPEGLFVQPCQEIDTAMEAIQILEKQIAEEKAAARQDRPDIDVDVFGEDADFETVVDETAPDDDPDNPDIDIDIDINIQRDDKTPPKNPPTEGHSPSAWDDDPPGTV